MYDFEILLYFPWNLWYYLFYMQLEKQLNAQVIKEKT